MNEFVALEDHLLVNTCDPVIWLKYIKYAMVEESDLVGEWPSTSGESDPVG